jgi:hypothetical protein
LGYPFRKSVRNRIRIREKNNKNPAFFNYHPAETDWHTRLFPDKNPAVLTSNKKQDLFSSYHAGELFLHQNPCLLHS